MVNVGNTTGPHPASDGSRRHPKFDVWHPAVLSVLIKVTCTPSNTTCYY